VFDFLIRLGYYIIMLEQKDIQAIGVLLDNKLKTQTDRLDKDIQAIGVLLDNKLKTQTDRLDKDIQAIGVLLDEKLKEQTVRFDGKLDDVLSAVNEGFTEMQGQFDSFRAELKGEMTELKGEMTELKGEMNEVKESVEKRPTRNEVFGWADTRIVDLEIAKERHDFLHIDELDKLPSPAEINKALIERGFKQKLV
jgi:hypothetical protein